eukprot:6347227-Amphidinium_carterae.1
MAILKFWNFDRAPHDSSHSSRQFLRSRAGSTWSMPALASLDGVPDLASLNVGRERYVTRICDAYKLLAANEADKQRERTVPSEHT